MSEAEVTIRCAAAALRSPSGDLAATHAALCADHASPGQLGPDLLAQLVELAGPLVTEHAVEGILLATTKADCPRWSADLLGSNRGTGGPAWLATQLENEFHRPCYAVSAACASGPAAVAEAARLLRDGHHRRLLVLGADRQGAFIEAGFTALQAIDPGGCRPFDQERAGLALGETMAALVLRSDLGEEDSTAPYLQGWGGSLDANHLTGPCRDGSGLALACRRALGDRRPDWISAHGTGTRFNDDSESLAYAHIAHDCPVVGWKGGLGHSLGASGLGEIALICHIIQSGQAVPGTCGLRQPGTAATLPVLPPGMHALAHRCILSTNAGFAGVNWAVCLGSEQVYHRPATGTSQRRLSLTCDHAGYELYDGTSLTGQAWPTAATADRLPRLTAKQVLGRIDASWGRMDLASRLLAATGELLDLAPGDTAVLLQTTTGSAESDRLFEQSRLAGAPDPQRFIYTLPTTPIGEVSIRRGLTGAGLALLGADDATARRCIDGLLADGHAQVLWARIDADDDLDAGHRAEVSLWQPADLPDPLPAYHPADERQPTPAR